MHAERENDPQLEQMDEAEIRAEVERIIASSLFHPSEQAILLLRYIVDCTLQGGEAPKEYRLAVEALGRGADFDPRNDTIVRVQVRKLRTKLAKYYKTDGLSDPIVIDLPVGLYTARFHKNEGTELPPESAAVLTGPRPRHGWRIRGLLAACCVPPAAYILFALFLRPAPVRIETSSLTRITWNQGLYLDPALSADGKKVVYTAYGENGNRVLYEQDTSGDDPIALTSGLIDVQEPVISPDGHRVIFRSSGQDSGLWELAVGSKDGRRRFSKEGRQPQFSPDGSQVAFWVPEVANRQLEPLAPLAFGPYSSIRALQNGRIFYTDPNTLRVRLLPLTLAAAGLPAWSPDGLHLIVYGSSEINGYRLEDADWWVAPTAQTVAPLRPVRTGIGAQLRRRGVNPILYPPCWVGNQLFFAASSGETVDIWQAQLSESSQVEGVIRKVTLSGESALNPTGTAAGSLAFSVVSSDVNVWSLPVQANTGVVTGPLERITQRSTPTFWSSVASDGSKMAYCTRRLGSANLYVKDMQSGMDRRLAAAVEHPQISPDGSRIVFGRLEGGKLAIYTVATAGGAPRRLSPDAGKVAGWAPDGRSFLFDREASHLHGHRFYTDPIRDTEFSRHPVADSFAQSISPKQDWVALICLSKLYVAPMHDEAAAPDDQWIQVTDGSDSVDLARWSPDGRTLYFVSNRDGHRCIWMQRLAAGSHRLEGQAIAVCHLHAPGPSMDHLSEELLSFDVLPTKMVFVLGGFTSTVYLFSR
jgi:Tol biopolymer transport system component